jgi:hypothetical protein
LVAQVLCQEKLENSIAPSQLTRLIFTERRQIHFFFFFGNGMTRMRFSLKIPTGY